MGGAETHELLEDGQFVRSIGKVERTALPVSDVRRPKHVQPVAAALQSRFADLPDRLADRPDHPEVADGCPDRAPVALDDNNL